MFTSVCSVAHSSLTLRDPVDCSPPGSSVHRAFQAWMLEWVAIPSSRGSSPSRHRTPVSWCLLHWQADSLPLCHPGSPWLCSYFLPKYTFFIFHYKRLTCTLQNPNNPERHSSENQLGCYLRKSWTEC